MNKYILHLLFICSIFLEKQALAEQIKLYTFYTPSHAVFKDDWFLPTLQDDFELIVEFYPQECDQAQWMRPGWTDTTLHKIEMVLRAIEDNWGTFFIYADIDIQFFKSMKCIIRTAIENKDMLFQRHNPDGVICSGFFVCRANEKTRALFLDIKQMMLNNKKMSDQPALNKCLIYHQNPYTIEWDYLPDTFFGGGTTNYSKKAWRPGMELSIPDNIILHHANCTRGIDNKIAQLKYVRGYVG